MGMRWTHTRPHSRFGRVGVLLKSDWLVAVFALAVTAAVGVGFMTVGIGSDQSTRGGYRNEIFKYNS